MGDHDQIGIGKFGELLKKAKPYLLMVALQFGTAGNFILSMASLNNGMNPYVLIVYRNATATLFLAPFALLLERKIRPKMTINVFLQIMVLGFIEPILDQGFTYLGMRYTSASFASAIMNAVPSVTFIIALIFRLEKIKIKEIRSQAKLIGTVVTLSGAILMTVYKGPVINMFSSRKPIPHGTSTSSSSDQHWLVGTLFVLIGCVSWSSFYILQSITVQRYRAEISLSSLICLMATIQSAALTLALERRASAWSIGLDTRLVTPLYTGVVCSGIAYYFQAIVMKTRGPVFVTAFNPLCMIIVAILASVILSEKIHLGSVIGGMVITIGLYGVVWGKSKDYSGPEITSTTTTNSKDEPLELPLTTVNNANSATKITVNASYNSDQQNGKPHIFQ